MINFFVQMKLKSLHIYIFKTTQKSYFKSNEKIPGNLLKKPGKIMEISWNFVCLKKWEPCKMNEWSASFVHLGLNKDAVTLVEIQT